MSKVDVSVGPGFPVLLTVLFVALKLLGKITWSWWLVLAPLAIPFGILLFLAGLAVVVGVSNNYRRFR